MADITDLYPPTPANVPPGLTRPPATYRTRVVVVLLCLLVFVAVYLTLTAGSAYACYACFAALVEDEPRPAPLPPTQPLGPSRAGPRVKQQPAYAPQPRSEKPVLILIVGGSPQACCSCSW